MANENRDFFVSRLETEIPAFVRVLKALPDDKLDYKPHEKCTAAGKLAWQLANEVAGLSELFETGDINDGPSACPSRDEIVSAFEKNASEALQRAKSVSEDRWNGQGRFLWEGKVVWPDTVMNIAWGFLFDMVHHRGQLSSYLRPMGGKVPAIYGPSGDSA
jgi:uncharacterized damage-inducible protein DinB